MDRDRHDARVPSPLQIERVELVTPALLPVARLVVLDDHRRDVVQLERVRHRHERPRRRPDLVGLVVVDPVRHVGDPLLGEDVERLPRLRKPGTEPALRRLAGEVTEELDGLTDGGALVGEEVHRALRDAVAHELPARVQHRPRDRLVRADHVGVDGRGRADLSLAERLEHPPEADAHAVVVPGPVGDVGHGRDPLRSGEVLAGGRRLDVPLLDVDDGPDGDARALGEPPGAPGGDGRIIEALVWQSHAGLLEASWPTDGCAYSTITGRGAAPRGRHSRPLLPRELSARHRGARRALRRARGPGEPEGPGHRRRRDHRTAPRRDLLGPGPPRPCDGQGGRPDPRHLADEADGPLGPRRRRPARGRGGQRRHGGGPPRLLRTVRRLRDAADARARPRPGRARARRDPQGDPRRVPRDQRERARPLRRRVRSGLRALRGAGAPGAAPPDLSRRRGSRHARQRLLLRHGLRPPARHHHQACAAREGGPGAGPRGQRPPAPPALVTAEFWITQAFNGLSYGALLFLLASGLSLIFGVMRIVNLAHGSYFMLGGYVGLSVVWRTGSFAAALVAGALAIALIGVGMERLFLRRLPGQTLGQVLMTAGFALMFQDLAHEREAGR